MIVVVLVQGNHGLSWGRVCISCSVLVIVGLFFKLGSETVCFVKHKTKHDFFIFRDHLGGEIDTEKP